jgi:hypothetical protein
MNRINKIHDGSFTVPLRFLIDNKKEINALYLFLKLRKVAIDKAGYVPKDFYNSLTRNEKERIIPKLYQKGWISKIRGNIKLNSIPRILETNHSGDVANGICVKVLYTFLESPKRLKEFILAALESYILKGKYISETKGHLEIDRDTKRLVRQQKKSRNFCGFETKRYSPQGQLSKQKSVYDLLSSRISHSMLIRWGYNSKQISRLRKGNINQYTKEFSKDVDPYSEKSFYSPKFKTHIKILPTKVESAYGLTFFFDRTQFANVLLSSGHSIDNIYKKKSLPTHPNPTPFLPTFQ